MKSVTCKPECARGGSDVSNICRPNPHKSCAACCGLYNVKDASAGLMSLELRRRSGLFEGTPRSVEALLNFKDFIATSSCLEAYDPEIHVCEFMGFLDSSERIVGCMLHPSSLGNSGIDLRGLCHYGAMACKSFYCPSWTELPVRIKSVVAELAPDWRTYGLIVTDTAFLISLFKLIECQIGVDLTLERLRTPVLRQMLTEVLLLKDCWSLPQESKLRVSAYYLRNAHNRGGSIDLYEVMLESLGFSYGADLRGPENKSLLSARINHFVKLFKSNA